jgi:hypothetical protein
VTTPARPALPSSVHQQLGERGEFRLEQGNSRVRAPNRDHLGAGLGEAARNKTPRPHRPHRPRSSAVGDESLGRRADRRRRGSGRREQATGACLPTAWMTSVTDRPRVARGDRERDAFGARTEPDDDELTGLARCCDPWGSDDQPVYLGRQQRVRHHLVTRTARGVRVRTSDISHRARSVVAIVLTVQTALSAVSGLKTLIGGHFLAVAVVRHGPLALSLSSRR